MNAPKLFEKIKTVGRVKYPVVLSQKNEVPKS
jgi:hypothetical protein